MATFTVLAPADAQRVCDAHALGTCLGIVPIAAGTVNSNYFLDTEAGRVFLRIYEQQEVDGVGYEWRLLDHLGACGVPVPPRVMGTAPGEVRVSGKPVAVFRAVEGRDLCQGLVTGPRLFTVGAALAQAAQAGSRFPERREGRFKLADVSALLERAAASHDRALAPVLARLRALRDELAVATTAGALAGLPTGVVHGDLFRDNVLWQGEAITALLDWESASDGIVVYDLAVTALAWCCGDSLSLASARSLVQGYRSVRDLTDAEWTGLWWAMRLGCLRFATTRIIDVYLKGTYPAGYKRYERFLSRLDTIESSTPEALATALGR